MKSIQAYLTIIDPRLLQHIKGKPAQFVQLLREQNFVSEEAFIRTVCGEEHGKEYYHNLKSRVLQILQSLCLMSPSRTSSLVKKKYDLCLKKFTIAQKFLNKGEREEGMRLVKQAHRIAINHDFVHLACETSSILCRNHAFYQVNKNKAIFFARLNEEYLRNYAAEKKAENEFYLID